MPFNPSLLGPDVTSVTASTTLGYQVGNTTPPTLLVISAAAGTTVTLPPITMGASVIGIESNQISVLNLAAQPVTLAAVGTSTIYGSSATVAQNVRTQLISDPSTNRWYRLN
jgi:hypothetical protein